MTTALLSLIVTLLMAVQSPNVPDSLRMEAVNLAQSILQAAQQSTPLVATSTQPVTVSIMPTQSTPETSITPQVTITPIFGSIPDVATDTQPVVVATNTSPVIPVPDPLVEAQADYDHCMLVSKGINQTPDTPDMILFRQQHYCPIQTAKLFNLGGLSTSSWGAI